MSAQEFRLPDVGEGLTEAEIVKWHVAAGDAVGINDVLVEIETAKSAVELPSPFAGTVTALLAEEGQTVAVGSPIVTIGEPDTKPTVLVGYGPSANGDARRRRAARTAEVEAPPRSPAHALAKPPVRKLAKDLGVDLTALAPSGPGGVVTRDDVLRHVDTGHGEAAKPERATRIPVKGVRKATAVAMSASAFTAPHVTEFLTVDVTRSVRLVDKLKTEPAFREHKVTMLLLVARALLTAAREFPEINSSWDAEAGEIVLHHEVNLGIAAATPRGLLVPNIKNAGALSLPALASALTGLVRTAREGKATPEDMSHGTITITNIGVFGVDAGTPILNPGEAAILCLGAVRRNPWEHKGRVALRWTTQLALSFDHRLVDGELGSKVLARIGQILADPEWQLILS
ncbi:dihydrolipoamide acetyltransferase family protein [Prauserella muralis]|uniref:Dihydrolipoamide acetyltransferase component of pyruvate dehydrogenase complex n=1 Tax=Prauserella muralis TaxID=588067 RepID=A0A2V4AG66_9PSEU|nr:dihydrolipoamide acetyltransferase family protein [Prauserella muralis]PXY18922.1 branched-chain alpha-keto acid dehydrogenase subunit E2 [Prauserella muralis]TWE28800.1 pyruvate dehydrogenase E2 component (dihydrolipoamide acetyltransferase) [Prauserella muralis]